MKRRIREALCIIITGYLSIQAQSVLSTAYPFGLPLRALSSTALSMGGVSVGIADDHSTMLANPGNLGTIDKTAFSSLILIDYLKIKDNNAYTNHALVSPAQVSFAMPLGILGTVAFSISKETEAFLRYRNDWLVWEKDTIRKSVHNTGGMSQWQVGWGHKIKKWANIGVSYERVYLTLNSMGIYEDKGGGLNIQVNDSTYKSFRGNGVRVGFLGTFEKVSFGCVVSYIFKDAIRYSRELYNKSGPGQTVKLDVADYTLQPPPFIAGGIGYAFSPKWLVGSDIAATVWKFSSLDSSVLPGMNQENTISLCAGARFIPAPNLLAPKYWETMHYRIWTRYTQLPDHQSWEGAISFGTGWPLKGNGLLDLGVEIGKRYTEKYSNFTETFIEAAIGINGGRKLSKSSSTYTY